MLFRSDSAQAVGQEGLDWLLKQVRDLPGLPALHYAIAQAATHLGQAARASEHLDWAEKFAPGDTQARGLRASLNGAAGPDRLEADSRHPG